MDRGEPVFFTLADWERSDGRDETYMFGATMYTEYLLWLQQHEGDLQYTLHPDWHGNVPDHAVPTFTEWLFNNPSNTVMVADDDVSEFSKTLLRLSTPLRSRQCLCRQGRKIATKWFQMAPIWLKLTPGAS